MSDPSNPLVREGTKMFVRYDSVHIVNSDTNPNGVKVQLRFLGENTASFTVDDIRLTTDSVLYLSGLEGRTELKAIQSGA